MEMTTGVCLTMLLSSQSDNGVKMPNMVSDHWSLTDPTTVLVSPIFATLMIHTSIIVERFGQCGTYNLSGFDTLMFAFRFRDRRILKSYSKFVKRSVTMVNLADEKRSIRSIIALSPPNPAPITVGHEHICLARPCILPMLPILIASCFLLYLFWLDFHK